MCSMNDPKRRRSMTPTVLVASMTVRASAKHGLGEVVPPIAQLDGRACECHTRGQRQVIGRGADREPDGPGLDDAPVVGAGVGELFGREPERDRPAFAGAQRDATEAAELPDGAGNGRLVVADVQLDDLVALAVTRVRDVDADRQLSAVRRELITI